MKTNNADLSPLQRDLVATGCDTAYIARWTRELGLISLWQECAP